MKTLIAILLSLSFVSLNAQNYNPYHKDRNNSLKLIGLSMAQLTLEAAGDAQFDKGNKVLGHSLQLASFGAAYSAPYLIDFRRDNWYIHLLVYTCLRIATFDLMYNAFRGLPYNYVGSTSGWDKFLGNIDQGNGFILPRAGFFTVGVLIAIRDFK